MSNARLGPRPGFVLIVTLWVLVVLGVILTNLSYQARVESAVERWALNQSLLRWAARGALHTAAARTREHLQDDFHTPAAKWWTDEELYRDLTLGAATVSILGPATAGEPTYGLDDEESRLNINVAHPDHLMGFAGVSSATAEAIALFRVKRQEALAEQTQRDAKKGQALTKDDPDEAQRSAVHQRVDGPIRALRELLAVEGVTEALLFDGHEERPPLASLWTTWSSGKINVNSASAPVLQAIGFGESAVALLLERRADEKGAFRSVDEALGLLDPDMHPKKRARVEKLLTVRSSTFRFTAQARLPQQQRAVVLEALLSVADERLAFVRWREG